MIFTKLAPAALVALVCSASSLLAQGQTPAPTPTPAVAPTPAPTTPAAVPAVQPSPTAVAASVQPDHTSEIALLDRIQKVLDTARDEQRANGSTVNIDRGLVDELRAEVTQVRMSLQGGKTPQSDKKSDKK